MSVSTNLQEVEAAIRATGLAPRGAIHPHADDGVPDMVPGRPAATLVLLGDAGPGMWRTFCAERDPSCNRLDTWTFDVVSELAESLHAQALFSFTRPHLPFQRWARRAGPCHVSPLRVLIHPDYGLWHSFRAALAFGDHMALPPPDDRPSPCDTCPDKPCLKVCPVDALNADGYDVPGCTAHLAAPAGSNCLDRGCLARRACPTGREFQYEPARANFHLSAFLRRWGGGRYPATHR
jgi:hypothetical protein